MEHWAPPLPSRGAGGRGLGVGGRSSLESPGVCASARLCVSLCMTGVGDGMYKHYKGAQACV